jgi:hypothetical protein
MSASSIIGGLDMSFSVGYGAMNLTSYGEAINITASNIHGTETGGRINLNGAVLVNGSAAATQPYVTTALSNYALTSYVDSEISSARAYTGNVEDLVNTEYYTKYTVDSMLSDVTSWVTANFAPL